MQLQFENPHLLWGLLFVLLLGFLLLRSKKRFVFSYRNLFLTLLAFIFCILALARPQWGRQVSTRRSVGTQLVLAVDISKSMLAEDVRPSRLSFATSSIQLLLEQLDSASTAIFPFAADGYLQVPFTVDRDTIASILPTLSPNMTSDQGTNLTQSLETLFQVLAKLENKTKSQGRNWFPTQVVLFSDGEEHRSLETDILHRFRAQNIPVHTIGVGTPNGGTIPNQELSFYSRDSFLKDRSGRKVISRLNAEPLKKISALTGGSYFSADLPSIRSLAKILQENQSQSKVVTKMEVDTEYYPYLLALALFCFLIEFRFGRWEYAIRSTLILFFFSTQLQAQTDRKQLLHQFETTEDTELRSYHAYNLGVYAMDDKNVKKAMEYFEESAYLAPPPLRKKALFNLGNALFHKGKLKESLQFYQRAYDTHTKDERLEKSANKRIRENMEFVARILEKARKQGGGSGKNDGGSGGEPKDPKGPKNDYEVEKFSEARKRRIFDLISSKEQQTAQRLQRRKKKGSARIPNLKPW